MANVQLNGINKTKLLDDQDIDKLKFVEKNLITKVWFPIWSSKFIYVLFILFFAYWYKTCYARYMPNQLWQRLQLSRSTLQQLSRLFCQFFKCPGRSSYVLNTSLAHLQHYLLVLGGLQVPRVCSPHDHAGWDSRVFGGIICKQIDIRISYLKYISFEWFMLTWLLFQKRKVEFIRIDGNTPAGSRHGLVEKFQNQAKVKAAVVSKLLVSRLPVSSSCLIRSVNLQLCSAAWYQSCRSWSDTDGCKHGHLCGDDLEPRRPCSGWRPCP